MLIERYEGYIAISFWPTRVCVCASPLYATKCHVFLAKRVSIYISVHIL